jgi:hypothetical protein
MRPLSLTLLSVGALGTVLFSATHVRAADDHDSIVIVYKDGHRQSLAAAAVTSIDVKSAAIVYRDGHREKLRAEIERIEFEDAAGPKAPGRAHYIGKWKVGQGNGGTFVITLEADGEARKSIGPPRGTWTLVDGEAHIAWDDGWHDAIRKAGSSHEKLAYEPGKTFSDEPSNVTKAEKTDREPI